MAENDQSNQRSGDEESYIESDHHEEKEFEFALSPAMVYNGIICWKFSGIGASLNLEIVI